MAATVLGKRTRGAPEIDAHQTRSKRRIVLNEPNDENDNPFARKKSTEEDESRILKPARLSTRPAKHGPPETRVATSPSKSPSPRKIGNPVVAVYEDGKNSEENITTPKTPRHRDALSKKIAITPRHRAHLNGAQLTPRSPQTPFNASTSIYNQARQLFSRCTAPGKLVGRDEERSELTSFVNACLDSNSAGCLYVSGPPGTGKSALVQETLQQYDDNKSVKQSCINCMSVKSATHLCTKLSEDLELGTGDTLAHLRAALTKGKGQGDRKYVVVLDEVDRLVDLDVELMYNLFDWSMQPASRLILIGIANALDLTDRLLPRLKGRNLKPTLLPFMPYSAQQIAEVITTKLKSLCNGEAVSIPFFQPAAIQFCAKKIGSQTGDLRKAFDICRRAVDLVEQETREKDVKCNSPSKTPLMENVNLSSPPTPKSPDRKPTNPVYTLESAPKATIAHVARITAQVFGNGSVQRLATLNIQQKAVLVALLVLEKRNIDRQLERTMFATPSKKTSSAPSSKQLFEAYSQMCNRDHLLHALTATEFGDVVSGLEALNLITIADAGKLSATRMPPTPSRTPRKFSRNGFGGTGNEPKRFASAVGEKELSASLDGPGGELINQILRGDGSALVSAV